MRRILQDCFKKCKENALSCKILKARSQPRKLHNCCYCESETLIGKVFSVAHAAVVNGATASAAQRMQQSIAETNIDGNELADKTENGPKKPLKMRFRKISRERRRRTERLSEQALAVRRRNERTTKLVMIIVMVFAVCIFPMQVKHDKSGLLSILRHLKFRKIQ